METVETNLENENTTPADDTASENTSTEPVSATVQSKITKEMLFDFYLFHAYSKLSGFLTNILGLAVFFLGVFSYVSGRISSIGCAVFVIASICFLGYTPLTLKLRSEREVREGKFGKNTLTITFTDKTGITVKDGEKETFYPWTNVVKASVTPKTIAVYVTEEEAIIIPKQDFGDKFVLCYQIIAYNLHQIKL